VDLIGQWMSGLWDKGPRGPQSEQEAAHA
jgi:hypothetical protein